MRTILVRARFVGFIVTSTIASASHASTVLNCDKSIVSFDKRDGTIIGRFDPPSLEETAKLSVVPGSNALEAEFSVCIDTSGNPVKRWDVMLPSRQFQKRSMIIGTPSMQVTDRDSLGKGTLRELQPLTSGYAAIGLASCKAQGPQDEDPSLRCPRGTIEGDFEIKRPAYFRIPWNKDEDGIYADDEYVFVRKGRWLHFYQRESGSLANELEAANPLSIGFGFELTIYKEGADYYFVTNNNGIFRRYSNDWNAGWQAQYSGRMSPQVFSVGQALIVGAVTMPQSAKPRNGIREPLRVTNHGETSSATQGPHFEIEEQELGDAAEGRLPAGLRNVTSTSAFSWNNLRLSSASANMMYGEEEVPEDADGNQIHTLFSSNGSTLTLDYETLAGMHDSLNHIVMANVFINGKKVASLEDPMGASEPLQALYWHGETSVVEFAGHAIVNGFDVGTSNGYDQVFFYRFLKGRPFYFFRKGQKYGISYDGVVQAADFDEIPHNLCCDAALYFSLRGNDSVVSFRARRGNRWYEVLAGVP